MKSNSNEALAWIPTVPEEGARKIKYEPPEVYRPVGDGYYTGSRSAGRSCGTCSMTGGCYNCSKSPFSMFDMQKACAAAETPEAAGKELNSENG